MDNNNMVNDVAHNDENETFICICGCGLVFENYSLGCDIYVGHGGLISEYQIVSDYCWGSYIPKTHNQWYQLKEFIIAKYENCKNDGEEVSKGWIHLYNNYCVNDIFNGNDKLDYENVF